MKIVIDIPDEYYELYKDTNNNVSMNGFAGLYLLEIIRKGKPLPIGHGRLIDADELELDYDWSEYETDTGQLMVYGYQAYSSTQIESAPTIIEADKEESEDKE